MKRYMFVLLILASEGFQRGPLILLSFRFR
jgi:hypothetical protein